MTTILTPLPPSSRPDTSTGTWQDWGSADWKWAIREIPVNHNVVGTCGCCGGPVISPMFWASTGHDDLPEWCMDCGRRPRKKITPVYGAVLEMEPRAG